MPDFESMSIEELEEYRANNQKERAELKEDFRAAGEALQAKMADTPKAKLAAEIAEKQAKLRELNKAEEADNG